MIGLILQHTFKNNFANSVHLSIDMLSYKETLKIKYVLFTIENKMKKKKCQKSTFF